MQYGGQYKDTKGFYCAECDGDLRQRNKIGFSCDWVGKGAVMTIGGGAGWGSCARAAHGIGVTDANEASFVHDQHGDVVVGEDEYDYGNTAWNVDPAMLPRPQHVGALERELRSGSSIHILEHTRSKRKISQLSLSHIRMI